MAKRKRTKGQTSINKALHKQSKIVIIKISLNLPLFIEVSVPIEM
jgi:hypothetical protein